MRNIDAYEYGFIDYRIVWRALSVSLPQDVEAIQRLATDRNRSWCARSASIDRLPVALKHLGRDH